MCGLWFSDRALIVLAECALKTQVREAKIVHEMTAVRPCASISGTQPAATHFDPDITETKPVARPRKVPKQPFT